MYAASESRARTLVMSECAGGVLPPLLDGKLLMRMPEARFRLLLPGDASSGTQLYKVSCRPAEGSTHCRLCAARDALLGCSKVICSSRTRAGPQGRNSASKCCQSQGS